MRLFAATGSAVAVLEGGDGSWHVSSTLAGSGTRCLALAGEDVVFAGGRDGVARSDDAGGTWNDTGLPHGDVFSVAVSPADGAVYAGCEPSMLFRSADGGGTWEELEALRRIPSAPTWSFPPRPWTSHVRWIAPSPHDAALLLAGIELGGVMRTDDGGATWLDHRPGAQPDAHALAWHPEAPGRAYEAGGGGAAWSFDGGLTWQPADAGRDRHYTWGLAVDPVDPDCWFVSASPGPRYAHTNGRAEAYVYRWRGEGPWEALGGGLPEPLDSLPYALLARKERLFAGLGDGRVYESGDGGDTWTPLATTGEPLRRILALAAA